MTATRKLFLLLFCNCILLCSITHAQGYTALNGSAYAGSAGIFNNPAASINAAYRWDFTPFSIQAKISSNSLYLKNFSLSKPGNGEISFQEKFHSRFIHSNADLSLFNGLYKLNNKQAITIGLRARTYTHTKTMPFQYSDTITGMHGFFLANAGTPFLDAFATESSWLEGDLNYSQVLMENSRSKLSGGITLQIMKGMAGAYVKLNKLSYLMTKSGPDTIFNFTGGSAVLGYSQNLDATSFKEFLKNSVGAFGLSMGIEYLTYNTELTDGYNHNLNYDWKIGVSLMDLGANTFKPGAGAGEFYNPQVSLSDQNVNDKLSDPADIVAFKDSLKTIFQASKDITSNYSISNPTRLIINIDKNFGNNLYVNGELSMNFYSSSSYTKLRTRELNLLTITPRWETIGLGAYLPVQYNTQGQLWIGMAVKAGPLLVGVHDLGLLFKKDPLVNGGVYLMLSVHPFSKKRGLGKMDCYE